MATVIPVHGGPLSSCSYIIQDEIKCWIVDCGDYPALKTHLKVPIEAILLTHGHFDHIKGLNELLDHYPTVRIYTNEFGKEMLINPKKNLSHYHESDFSLKIPSCINLIRDRQEVKLGNNISAIPVFTPGHNPSCITWIIDNAIFTGDSYIPECKIVTNLPDGNKKDAYESIRLIKELSLGRVIYPGHNITI